MNVGVLKRPFLSRPVGTWFRFSAGGTCERPGVRGTGTTDLCPLSFFGPRRSTMFVFSMGPFTFHAEGKESLLIRLPL
ncbi:MAG TPA: hypothetical protein VJB58_00055 [Candidatus Paceibacterota bacterium]